MKNTRLFILVMTAILGLAVWMPQNTQASERSKKVGDCVTCKRPVYSYRHLQTYSRGKPVYTWKISGHSQCQSLASGADLVKHEVKGKSAESKSSKGKKAEAKKTASHQKAKKQPETKNKNKNKSEPESYAQHGGQQAPQAYGGGSGYGGGYGGGNYGAGYGGQGYGNPFQPGFDRGYGNGYRQRVYGGREFGYGYGNRTVSRSTTVTRSTPSTLGSVGGGFSGTSTRTYNTRTRTNYRGSYGRIWGGSTYKSRPYISHY